MQISGAHNNHLQRKITDYSRYSMRVQDRKLKAIFNQYLNLTATHEQ